MPLSERTWRCDREWLADETAALARLLTYILRVCVFEVDQDRSNGSG